MNKKENRIFLEDQQNNFLYQKSKSNLNKYQKIYGISVPQLESSPK